MVYLNRIYTRSGDEGETSLGDGTRTAKTSPRIQAYGIVDELNSTLGVVLLTDPEPSVRARLRSIQNDLFDLGADLCVPESHSLPKPPLRMAAQQVAELEHWIDETNEDLQPLTSFVLPGGTPAAAHLHVARTICRRAEIAVWQLAETEPLNPEVARYLNRLSDYLFVLARWCNQRGQQDVLWQPGQSHSREPQ
jgi:cob(I)alamin adenosyltransferase